MGETKRGGKGTAERRATGKRFYARVLTQEEIDALAEMASNHPTLQEEISLLKVLIRRKLEEGTDLADVVRAVDALGRALKVQKAISDEGRQGLRDAFVAAVEGLADPE